MNFQERLQTLLPDFEKGATKDNLAELMEQYQTHGPLISQILSKPEEGESVQQLYKAYGYK
jgi:hypothetical protein